MTEELKPHQIAQLVNKLRDIATKYHAHGCLRELISREVNAALTQRPAAQTEREADGLPLIVAGAIFDFAGFMTTRSEVIEVGSTADAGPVADLVKEWAELRGLDLADAAVLSWQLHITRASLPAPQQATPEPLGDAPIWNSIQIASWIGSQLMHEPAMFERATVCKFVRALGRHPTLLKHSPKDNVPAPGVPEDVLAILDECRNALMECDRDGDYALIDRIDVLAAAQAKGGQ